MPRRKEKQRMTTESVKGRQGSLTEKVSRGPKAVRDEQSSALEKQQAGRQGDCSEAGHLKPRLELGTASRREASGRREQARACIL